MRAPTVQPHNTCVFAQYTVEVEQREIVETRMKAAGVPTAVHYPLALHMQPVFKHLGHKEGDFPEAERAARETLALPMFPELTEDQQHHVVQTVRRFF